MNSVGKKCSTIQIAKQAYRAEEINPSCDIRDHEEGALLSFNNDPTEPT